MVGRRTKRKRVKKYTSGGHLVCVGETIMEGQYTSVNYPFFFYFTSLSILSRCAFSLFYVKEEEEESPLSKKRDNFTRLSLKVSTERDLNERIDRTLRTYRAAIPTSSFQKRRQTLCS